MPTKAVLLTAGMLHLDQTQLTRWTDEIRPLLSASNSSLDVVDLRQNEVLDPLLTALAGWSRKPVQRAHEGRQLDLRLREILSGKSQLVAHDVSLRVNFVPGAVSLYRLLGHEASAVSNLIPLEWQTDLHSGETATALFEIAVRPNGPEIVAHATLEWRDMAGKLHTRKQPIRGCNSLPPLPKLRVSLQLCGTSGGDSRGAAWLIFCPYRHPRPGTGTLDSPAASAADSSNVVFSPARTILAIQRETRAVVNPGFYVALQVCEKMPAQLCVLT